MSIITIELLAEIKKHFRLKWFGIHGIIHWSRVYYNGIKLSDQEGVNVKVVKFFSVFHDSQRRNESWDKHHGKRGADLAVKLRNHLPINDDEFQLLVTACSFHTSAQTHDNLTVQACFDSDRLDLGRVGNYPNPDLLCTPLAKQEETIKWAYDRSINNHELTNQPFGLDIAKEDNT